MYDFDKSKRRIVVIDGEIATLRVERATLEAEIQKNCIHSNVIESPKNFINYRGPLRGCVDCQHTEEKLFGFKALDIDSPRQVSGEEFESLIPRARNLRFFWNQNE